MNICEIEFASSSIAFSVKNINELELSLFSLEFNYSKTTSLELNSLKTNSRKLNFPHTPDFTELNFHSHFLELKQNQKFRFHFFALTSNPIQIHTYNYTRLKIYIRKSYLHQ